ncbi:MAG: hypothetical protein GY856_23240 [bacterium]|nr:hypothetical protein [bacterium]
MNEAARQQVLQCLRELGDPTFQERVWLRGEGPEVSSYQELVSQLYDDTTLGDLLEDTDGGQVFSPEADLLLHELSNALDRMTPAMGLEAMLQHPKWERIRELAARAASFVEASM